MKTKEQILKAKSIIEKELKRTSSEQETFLMGVLNGIYWCGDIETHNPIVKSLFKLLGGKK